MTHFLAAPTTTQSKSLSHLIILLVLGTVFSCAYAQNWVGLRSGFPLGVTLHYGVADALSDGSDLRVSGTIRSRGGDVAFGVGVDALNELSIAEPFVVYAGGGPALDFSQDGSLLDVHVLLGGEFLFADVGLEPLGVFAELTLGVGIGLGRPSEIPTFGGALGINYRF